MFTPSDPEILFSRKCFYGNCYTKIFFQEDAHNTLTCNLKSKKHLVIPTKETSQIQYSSTPLSTGNMFQDPWMPETMDSTESYRYFCLSLLKFTYGKL